MLDAFDSEGISDWLHAVAGVDPSEPVGAEWLARRTPGIAGIRDDARSMLGTGALTWGHNGWTIWVSPRLGPTERNWTIAHELVEFANRTTRGEPFLERACNQGAAAIVAPRAAFRAMHGAIGDNFAEMGEAFVATESLIVLRRGEVIGTPIALVTPTFVSYRGADWGWPDARELRRMTKAGELPEGHRSIRLTDDVMRIAVLADAA